MVPRCLPTDIFSLPVVVRSRGILRYYSGVVPTQPGSSGIGQQDGLCLRCPVGTYQPSNGRWLQSLDQLDQVCTKCAAGMIDDDSNPTTRCVLPDRTMPLIESWDAAATLTGYASKYVNAWCFHVL